MSNEKTTGVWIDNRNALLITYQNNKEHITRISSEVDESHPKGGAGSSTPYGAQDAISESAYLERRKQQFKVYYHKIAQELQDSSAFVVMGPAEAKTGLTQFLDSIPNMKEKCKAIETYDSFTENQIKARVRTHFAIDS